MMSARLFATIALVLSLPLSGSTWAHSTLLVGDDSGTYNAIEGEVGSLDPDATPRQGDPAASDRSGGSDDNCDHHDAQPTRPAVDDKVAPPTRSTPGNPHDCCADGNCPCPPIGKGMAIGPAHLASQRAASPYAPVEPQGLSDTYQSLLRPPIP